MRISHRHGRLLLLGGVAALPLFIAEPAAAETICRQFVDGEVFCDDGSGNLATGPMTPDTVEFGPGLVAISGSTLDGTITGDIHTMEDDHVGVLLDAAGALSYVQDGDVVTEGDNAIGVYARSGTEATVRVGNVITSGDFSEGISAESVDATTVTCSSVTTTGANSRAIAVFASDEFGGTADLTCGDLSATGAGSAGVALFAPFGGSVDLGDITSNGIGLNVGTSEGPLQVSVGSITTTGDNAIGMNLFASDGSITATCGDIHTSGTNSAGIATSVSDGSISVTCGDITTEGDGSAGAILVDGTYRLGDVTTLGNDSRGVVLAETFGVSAMIGNVHTEGSNSGGIAYFADSGNTLVAGDISTAGDDSTGVLIESVFPVQGVLDVTLGHVSTAGADSHGVDLRLSGDSFAASAVALSVGGAEVSGAGSDAIRISSRTFELTDLDVGIATTGDVTSADGTAIFVETSGAFDMAIAEGIVISGRTGGIVATAGMTNLDIAGTVQSADGPAMQALGGPATVSIASTGSVNGFVRFGDAGDLITNAGLFAALGASDFGAGSDLFTNRNVLTVNGSAAFAGLETFDNAGGTIDLQDGAADDRLDLSGDYQGGAGAAVLLDVSRSLDAADVLAIAGDVSGETLLAINFVDSDAPVNLGGVLLVEGVTDPDAFTVEGLEDFGLFALALRAGEGGLYLQAAVDPGVADFALLASVGPDTWYQSLDAIRAGIAGRGSLLPRLGFWAQGYGGRDRYGERRDADLFGFEVPVSTRIETERLGAQIGFDGSVGSLLLGATAGYEQAKADAGLDSDIDTRGFNVGAYAGFGAAIGPYGSVAVKHDRLDVELSNPTLAVPDLDATATGGDVEIGWRSNLALAAIDLGAGLSAVRSHIDGFSLGGLDFDPGHTTSVRGRLGARATFAGPLAPFAGARLFHEFSDHAGIAIVGGSLRSDLDAADRGTWGRVEAGIGGGKQRPLLSAWADIGDRKGFGLRAGFRF